MSYRTTSRYDQQCEKLARMRNAKDQYRLYGESPDYPVELPEIRKRITVETFDFGLVTQVMELHKTRRIDLYDVYIDGKLWKSGIGLSRILEWIRKANPRMLSKRSL